MSKTGILSSHLLDLHLKQMTESQLLYSQRVCELFEEEQFKNEVYKKIDKWLEKVLLKLGYSFKFV